MVDKHVLRVSFTTQSFHLSVRPSVSPFVSHDQYMQRHSPDASLPGRACSLGLGLGLRLGLGVVLGLGLGLALGLGEVWVLYISNRIYLN